MVQPSTPRLLAVIIGLILLIAPLSAATVTMSPSTITEDTPITITVHDLADNSTFMIRVSASIPLDGDGRFQLSTNNLQMPFALDDGRVSIHAENVKAANLTARMGGRAITIFGDGENGVVDMNQMGDIPQGLISYITLEGVGLAASTPVVASVDLSGKKIGPDDSVVTFSVNGFTGGSADVKVYVDGVLVPTTPTTTAPSSSGGGGDDPVTTTEPEPESVTVTSPDSGCALSFESGALEGAESGDLSIWVSNRAVPEGWTAVKGPYAILPDGVTFNPSATISISMDGVGDDTSTAYTLLAWNGQAWNPLQSRIEGDVISAEIDEGGEFALATPPVVVTTAPAAGEPAETVTIIETTAAPTAEPTTTPAQSPLPLICTLGALGAAAAIIVGRR
ncbi:hypothetical protein [Methanofollis fontis]|uniref:Uncharacterized protein n=1 Tax=Methanofollis fontis TaxID=2052832 RepID=A0A483CZ68_9EURY|nr:hypothetical protein [Methanofollis fontis]TAJ45309.1 hypothetical protein CUJ86_00750 [Methanofollis fontis]